MRVATDSYILRCVIWRKRLVGVPGRYLAPPRVRQAPHGPINLKRTLARTDDEVWRRTALHANVEYCVCYIMRYNEPPAAAQLYQFRILRPGYLGYLHNLNFIKHTPPSEAIKLAANLSFTHFSPGNHLPGGRQWPSSSCRTHGSTGTCSEGGLARGPAFQRRSPPFIVKVKHQVSSCQAPSIKHQYSANGPAEVSHHTKRPFFALDGHTYEHSET